ncbi:hypothetical protein GCM10009415_26370 [Chitinophaga japonensis]
MNSGMAIELGVKFRSSQKGRITGVRFYKGARTAGDYTVHLWDAAGTSLATATLSADTTAGWQQVALDTPVAIQAHTTYVASYFSKAGDYATTNPFFSKAVVSGYLRALADGEDGPNGLYKYADKPAFPDKSFGTSNYWVDVVFLPDATVPATPAGSVTAATGKDETAPNVSSIHAEPGADGTAVVSWSTDENADATVHYDANADQLNLHVDDPTPALDHRLRLNGLVPGVTYYFRIASKDKAGNTVTRPPVTAPPLTFTVQQGPCAVDSSIGNFSQGATDIGALINPNGTVTLQPQINEEFISVLKAIPEGWSGARYNADGTTVNNEGVITVNGTHIFSNHSFEPGSSIEFMAAFGAGTYQNIGFSIDQPYADGTWVTIGQGGQANGNIYARASNNSEISLGANLLGALHHYRIKWNAGNFEFFVDGSEKPAATINIKITAKMFIQVSDYVSTDGGLSVDWLHVTPYTPNGVFTSRVFDAGDVTDWGLVSWHADTPAGTSVSLSVSTGNSPNPNDGTWTAFKPLNPGEGVNSSGRYVQYKAALKTTDTKVTPVLRDVTLNCKGNSRMIARAVPAATPEKAPAAAPANAGLHVKVSPNPSSDYFELVPAGSNDKPIMINILDIYGRIVEYHQKVAPGSTLQVGQSLSPGNYFVEMLQGSERKTVKIVKVR